MLHATLPSSPLLRQRLIVCTVLAILSGAPAQATPPADPAHDIRLFRDYFKQRFPAVAFADYATGASAIDAKLRDEINAFEEFQPYDPNIRNGKKLFETPFRNGARYADCFANGGIGIRQHYPRFDSKTGEVQTLETVINACRTRNAETALDYLHGDLADISAYMAYTSRGKTFNIKVPAAAREAYARGREFFFTKRGQLNLSCADCHMQSAGQRLRGDTLSPAPGHTTHFPVYRFDADTGGLETLHSRYRSCNALVLAKPLAAQGRTYRELEYFETVIGNGLAVNGPAVR